IERTFSRFSPATFLAAQIIPNYLRAVRTTAFNQTLANQTLIACALERYYVAHHFYPSNLAGLKPDFIARVPSDLIGGIPLHYTLRDNGLYLLYSVGWNGTDEHGLNIKTAKGGRFDTKD